MDVDVVGGAALEDLERPALVRRVAHPHPEQEAAVVELMLEVPGPVAAEEACGPAAEQAAAAARDRGGRDHRRDGPARGLDRAGRDHRADIRRGRR